MADRHTLSVSRLEDFKQWLVSKGWTIQSSVGCYEVLRARKADEKLPLLVYKKCATKNGNELVHLSVSDWNARFVRQYLKDRKELIG